MSAMGRMRTLLIVDGITDDALAELPLGDRVASKDLADGESLQEVFVNATQPPSGPCYK